MGRTKMALIRQADFSTHYFLYAFCVFGLQIAQVMPGPLGTVGGDSWRGGGWKRAILAGCCGGGPSLASDPTLPEMVPSARRSS